MKEKRTPASTWKKTVNVKTTGGKDTLPITLNVKVDSTVHDYFESIRKAVPLVMVIEDVEPDPNNPNVLNVTVSCYNLYLPSNRIIVEVALVDLNSAQILLEGERKLISILKRMGEFVEHTLAITSEFSVEDVEGRFLYGSATWTDNWGKMSLHFFPHKLAFLESFPDFAVNYIIRILNSFLEYLEGTPISVAVLKPDWTHQVTGTSPFKIEMSATIRAKGRYTFVYPEDYSFLLMFSFPVTKDKLPTLLKPRSLLHYAVLMTNLGDKFYERFPTSLVITEVPCDVILSGKAKKSLLSLTKEKGGGRR